MKGVQEMKWIRKRSWIVLAGVLLIVWGVNGYAAEPEGEVEHLEDITVKGKAGAPGIEPTPSETVIELDKFPTIGVPDNVLDVLKTQAIVDFRGETDIDPGVDSVYLRGFDARHFVTAIDGLTVQKTGGRKSSNIVDYALLPPFLVDKI